MKYSLTLSLVFLALIGTSDPAAAQSEAWVRRWRTKVAAFQVENERLPAGDPRPVVLFGSSSTEGWRYAKRIERFLPELAPRILNRGISGDGIGTNRYGLKNRLESSVFGANPSHVFILNGRNSIGRSHRGVERTARVYREVVIAIQERLPDTTVCIITCAPVNHRYAGMAPYVRALNKQLRALAAERDCPLIDLHPQLVGPGGLMRTSATRDGLHFRDEGYRWLGPEIARVVRESETPPEPDPLPLPEQTVAPDAPPASDPFPEPLPATSEADEETEAEPCPQQETARRLRESFTDLLRRLGF